MPVASTPDSSEKVEQTFIAIASKFFKNLFTSKKIDVSQDQPVNKPVFEFQASLRLLRDLVILAEKWEQPLSKSTISNAEMLLSYSLENGEDEAAVWLASVLKERAIPLIKPKSKFTHWLMNFAQFSARGAKLSKEDLDFFALELGFGYKTANLMVMGGKVEAIAPELQHCLLKVPPFVGISDAQTWQFLLRHIPDLQGLWEEFIESFDTMDRFMFLAAESPEAARKVTLYPTEKGKEILTIIRNKITEAYSTSPYVSHMVDQWLKLNPSEFVIVRSTGREDSEKNSNAGGNASIPNVRPNAEAISTAIGQVVASYFGETSIIQRLQAGDQSLFKEEPFLPVLVQQMICERNIGGVGSKLDDIPRSGVLFTKEHGKADVTLINAAYGSNEGVVNSQVAVDTYEVHSKGIYSTVRSQPTRFVHTVSPDDPSKYVVSAIENHPDMRDRRVLNSTEIRELQIVANRYASLYGNGSVKEMDMEFTMLKDEKGRMTIYPLQIRPLLSPAAALREPSFINLSALKKIPLQEREKVTVFMTGSPAVRLIARPQEEVIFAEDLPDALKKYESHPSVKDIQLIVIKKPAAATSHPAVMLRPTNIPIFVVSDPKQWTKVQSLLKSSPALVCSQRGLVVKKTIEDITKKGLVSYPSPLELSLPNRAFASDIPEKTRNQLKKQFLEQVDEAVAQWQSGPISKEASFEELFDMMALQDTPTAKQALATLFLRLSKTMKQVWGKATKDNLNKQKLADELFEVLYHSFKITQKNLVPALDQPPQSMDRLFHLKKLSSLILQEGSNEVVESLSVKSILQRWETVSSVLSKDFKGLGIQDTPENTYLLSLQQHALNEEAKNKWLMFVKKLSKEQKLQFIPMVKLMLKANVFMAWMHTPVFLNSESYEDIYNNIAQARDVLNLMSEKQGALDQLSHQIPLWENPVFVEKQMASLKGFFENNLGCDGDMLVDQYKTAPYLGKMAILSLLRKAVGTYDTIIKSVTGSKSYSDKRMQARHFHALLGGYMKLLETTMGVGLPAENALVKTGYPNISFTEYLDALENGREYGFGFSSEYKSPGLNALGKDISVMSQDDLSEMFKTRSKFNVSALAIGSRADLNFSAHWPATLEEYFTTIHQSAETIISHMQTKLGLNPSILPQHMKALLMKMPPRFGRISDIAINDKTITVRYQIAIRQHAVTLIVTAGKDKTAPIQLTVSAYGNEENDRWKQSAAFSAILVNRFNLRYAANARPSIDYVNPTGVEFTLEIPADYPQDREKLYAQLLDCLQTLLFLTTMDGDPGPSGLGDEIESQPGFKSLELKNRKAWVAFPEATYEQSFYLGIYAMRYAWKAASFHRLIDIARSTLLGLKNYGLKDFSLFVNPYGAQDWQAECLIDPSLEYYTLTSLAKTVFAALLLSARKDPSLFEHVNKLLHDPEIASHFPEEAERTLSLLSSNMRGLSFHFKSGHTMFAGPAPNPEDRAFELNEIKTVVSLLEPEAMKDLDLYNFYAKKHIHLIPFPIEDFGVPHSIGATQKLVDEIIAVMDKGNLFIHCQGGKGRTGMIVACITARLHPEMDTQKIITYVRKSIPNAIENVEQEKFIEAFVKAQIGQEI